MSAWLTTSDAEAWSTALPAGRSAFGSVGFARVQERFDEVEARLLVVEVEGARIARPLLLRPLAGLPFATELRAGTRDAATPPFTGPFVAATAAGALTGAALSEAAAEMNGALATEGVVAEFNHLHPFAADARLLSGVEADREIVWVDLALDEERLWRESYSKACRKNVNRAQREDVVVRPARDADDIGEFHRIYIETMRRNDALASYFFGREYFQAIFEEMPKAARFALAEHEGAVIAATLYLHDDEDVYSYLGGADHSHQHLRPTNAVVHETSRWAREQGKRRLILGGGYRPDDGIMRFKASFSPRRATLELARLVHLPDDYELLVDAWRAHHGGASQPTSFFPAYRAGAPG